MQRSISPVVLHTVKKILVAWLKFPKLSWYRISTVRNIFGAIVKPLLRPSLYAQLSGKAKWFAHILDGGGLGNGRARF